MGRLVGTENEAVEPGATAERLWTVRDCAKYLAMSVSWVYKQVEANAIPHAKLGAALRFHPARVREYAATLGAAPAPGNVVPFLRKPV